MIHTVTMPKLGQTGEEATIVKWRKREGELVGKGDILFEIETDKAVLEIESFFEGTLLKIAVAEGLTVPVMAPVAFIGEPGDAIPDVKPVSQPVATAATTPVPVTTAAPWHAPVASVQPVAAATAESVVRPPLSVVCRPAFTPGATVGTPVPALSVVEGLALKIVSPRARRLIRECAVSADRIPGTGPGGRVVEKDVQAYLEAQHYAALKITPDAKNLARKNGIDILTLTPPEDGEHFTAIINPGESAILAVASTRPTPVVRDGKIEIRAMMKITLSSDHRLVDGAVAARFVNRVKSMLEDLALWKSMI